MFQDELVNRIAGFLTEVGIEVVPASLEQDSFLPGIQVLNGKLLVDEAKLIYPGDLLHEAGHLAVAPGYVRHSLSGEVIIPGADMDAVEAQATAWAYAATIHRGLDTRLLSHDGGYKGTTSRWSDVLVLTRTSDGWRVWDILLKAEWAFKSGESLRSVLSSD